MGVFSEKSLEKCLFCAAGICAIGRVCTAFRAHRRESAGWFLRNGWCAQERCTPYDRFYASASGVSQVPSHAANLILDYARKKPRANRSYGGGLRWLRSYRLRWLRQFFFCCSLCGERAHFEINISRNFAGFSIVKVNLSETQESSVRGRYDRKPSTSVSARVYLVFPKRSKKIFNFCNCRQRCIFMRDDIY